MGPSTSSVTLHEPDDLPRGLQQIGDVVIRGAAVRLTIRHVEQERGAAGRAAGGDVAPAIADHEARPRIDVEGSARLFDQTSARLPAVTPVRVVVVAGVNGIQG